MRRMWSILAAALLAAPPAHSATPVPDACTIVTASDVSTAVGPGFNVLPDPFGGKMRSGESSTCSYAKGPGNVAAIFIIRNPGGSAKSAVLAREQQQKRAGRTVASIPGLCDAAFSVTINAQKTNVVAAKGGFQLETEVIVGGKADAAAAQKLAALACSRL